MKKYILGAMFSLMLFPGAIYAKCCDCYYLSPVLLSITGTTTKFTNVINRSMNSTGIEKLIGKTVHRTAPINFGYRKDDSFMGNPQKLLAITDKYLILTPDTAYSNPHALERDIWDDGNWEEIVKKLLTVTEITASSRFSLTMGFTDKYCVRCGGKLLYILNCNYYCGSCKTEYNIKED